MRTPDRHPITPEVRRAIVKWCLQSALGLCGFALMLFLCAGTLDWVWGWVLLGVVVSALAAHPLILIPINPELLAEREKGMADKAVKAWDRRITALAGALLIASWILAGLDARFGWTGPPPAAYHAGGLLVTVLGYALFLWAMASNAFFSEGCPDPEGAWAHRRHPRTVPVRAASRLRRLDPVHRGDALPAWFTLGADSGYCLGGDICRAHLSGGQDSAQGAAWLRGVCAADALPPLPGVW